MEISTQEALKAHLMQTNEEFRQMADQHSAYHHKLEELEAKPYLTPDEEVEEHRLKKLKLHLKDEMLQVMSRYKTQSVA